MAVVRKLELEGDNLGERHRYLNTQVNKAVGEKVDFNTVIADSGDSAVDRLFKIDIANKYKNVEYIVKVLQSDDMLHVGRAMNNIAWLISDEQYSHIINPEYLHEHLFPHMKSKAISKILSRIKLYLRDEVRVDLFYKYEAATDIKKALKWLPYCSLSVIKECLNEHNFIIQPDVFKRLCENHSELFALYITKGENQYLCRPYLEVTTFIIYEDCKLYLDVLERFNNWYWPKFGKRLTAFLMKNEKDRVITKFHIYNTQINMEIFAKYIPTEDIKGLIKRLSKNNKLENWFCYNNIKALVKRLPKEGKFEFLKTVFIDKATEEDDLNNADCAFKEPSDPLKSEYVYQWYRHAPFATAFPDLKKLMKLESSAEERSSILKVMVTTARADLAHINNVLQYYHSKHINEAFKFKIIFLNALILDTKTHRYDESSWKLLDELFHSAEVYSDSDKKVQNCVEAILVYKILHKQTIPEIIEQKFNFNTLKQMKCKFDKNEKEEIFSYLYKYLEKKLHNQSVKDQSGACKKLSLICDIMDLIKDWDKKLTEFPTLLNEIKELATLKHEQDYDVNLETIYNKNKLWKRELFDISLLLSRREAVYINALKHDPTLFGKYPKEVEAIQSDDKVYMWRVFYKLLIYWENTIARDWADAYHSNLKLYQTKGHRALVRGLCGILPRQELLILLTKYAPEESKIAWSEIDESLLNLRKNFGEMMYKSRSQIPLETIMRYAVGDYIQFTMPTLNSVFYNLTSFEAREIVPKLLSEINISLQKCGTRIAFSKLKATEINKLFSDLWRTTQNVSMRSEIFKLTYNLLCSEKNDTKMTEIWGLLEIFIDNLTSEENPLTYKLLGSANKVPEKIRAKFCMKSLTFLKSLPPKCNVQRLIQDTADSTADVMDSMDKDYAIKMILELYESWVVKSKVSLIYTTLTNIIVKFILSSTDEADQMSRYNMVIKPLLSKLLANWHEENDNEEVFKFLFDSFIKHLLREVIHEFLNKKHLNPLPIAIEITKELESKLPLDENYSTITTCNLIVSYMQCYEEIKHNLEVPCKNISNEEKRKKYATMWKEIVPLYANKVIALLERDVERLYPSILFLFSTPLSDVTAITMSDAEGVDLEMELLKDNKKTLACMLAVQVLPESFYHDERNKKLNEIRELILNNHCEEVRMHCLNKLKVPLKINEDVIPYDDHDEFVDDSGMSVDHEGEDEE